MQRPTGGMAACVAVIMGVLLAAIDGRAQDYQLSDVGPGSSVDGAPYADISEGYVEAPYAGMPDVLHDGSVGCGMAGGCEMGGTCGACPRCVPVPCGGAVWFQSDYLMWWTKGNRLPALVTTSPEGTERNEAGVLGFDDTGVLHGDERLDGNMRSGLRYRLGAWLNPCYTTGLEGHYFYLNDGNNTGDYSAESFGDPILARPFFNTQLNAQDAQLIAFPGVVQGRIDIRTSSEMHSAGALLRQAVRRGPGHQLDLLAGYRFLRYREGLTIGENLVVNDVPGFPQGTRIDLSDTFATENDFHGAEIGLNSTLHYHALVVDFVGKLAFGNVHQQVRVNGVTERILPNGDFAASEGGLLALPTNIGERSRNEFAFVPEMNLNVRYPLTCNLDLTVGYSLLYLTRAVRTGDQIDTVVNPSQLIQNGGQLQGPERPAPFFHDTAIWAQGLNVGVNWVY